MPSHAINIITARVFLIPAAGTGRIFPFGFRGQPERTIALGVQPLDELLCVIPEHLFNRLEITFEVGWIAPHDTLPLGLRHFILAHPETIHAHLMHRLLVIISITVIATHLEAPARNPHELYARGRVGVRGARCIGLCRTVV